MSVPSPTEAVANETEQMAAKPSVDPALLEERWRQYNEKPRSYKDFQQLLFGDNHPTAENLPQESSRRRILQVELSPKEPEDELPFPVNLRQEDQGHADFAWTDRHNAVLPKSDLAYEAELLLGYMEQFGDRDDEKALEHKNFYQLRAPELIPALGVSEQKLFVRAFQWYTYEQHGQVTEGWGHNRGWTAFRPLNTLYETIGVPLSVKQEAAQLVEGEILTGLEVAEDRTAAQALMREYTRVSAELLFGIGYAKLMGPYSKEAKTYRDNDALAKHHLPFVARHMSPDEKNTDLTSGWDEDDDFFRAMKYIKDPQDRHKLGLYHLENLRSYQGKMLQSAAHERILKLFPRDKEVERAVASLHEKYTQQIEEEKRFHEELERKYPEAA